MDEAWFVLGYDIRCLFLVGRDMFGTPINRVGLCVWLLSWV